MVRNLFLQEQINNMEVGRWPRDESKFPVLTFEGKFDVHTCHFKSQNNYLKNEDKDFESSLGDHDMKNLDL